MKCARHAFAAGVAIFAASAQAGGVVLPSDVSVSLSAEPTFGLEPQQAIHFTLRATNNGPEPIPLLALTSSPIYDELTLYDGTNDCGLITQVADGPTDFWYYRVWYAARPDFTPALAVGETRICHFTESLTSSAPATTSFSFGFFPSWSDPDPGNDTSTVYLHRAIVAMAVPTLSTGMVLVLASLLVTVTFLGLRRERP